ncbi:unnamed protein product [Didymodactylos carnosus]|uniref:DUF4371 domain-containing protein n=1 Tax=Didymodactylos carnosus TaxID=1234261 RepID=A0A814VXB5_9BILA|nr:unnamed protein product [Didymodactylos carnosus]CAF3960787.1 unnamed protein product [Didymodactylos carnosus]
MATKTAFKKISMGERNKMNRKTPSGAAKRKINKEKKAKRESLISKIPKTDTFLKTQSNTNSTVLTNIDINTASTSAASEIKDVEDNENIHKFHDQEHSISITDLDSDSSSIISDKDDNPVTNENIAREDITNDNIEYGDPNTSRGLAFRGNNQIIGDNHNGNYLGCLELISNFDPFLHGYSKNYGNKGKGNVSYLSDTVSDEFIEVMGNHVRKLIIMELKKAKYYSIIIDSTPDIAHLDQLTFVVRYVDPSGSAVERFLMFIENVGHKSSAMEDAILNVMDVLEINLNDCRGQSYDNAANMSRAYSGLQSRIHARNDLTIYVPCAAHSLNLIGECAAECYKDQLLLDGFRYRRANKSQVTWRCVKNNCSGRVTFDGTQYIK